MGILIFLSSLTSTAGMIYYNIQNIDNLFTIWNMLCWLIMLVLIRLTVDSFFYFRFSVIVSLAIHLMHQCVDNPLDETPLYREKQVNYYMSHSISYTKEIKSCSICTEDFKESEFMDNSQSPLQILSCGHLFHRDCILKNETIRWFQGRDEWLTESQCPTCRNTNNVISGRHDFNHNIDKGIFSSFYNADHEKYQSDALYNYLWTPVLNGWYCVFDEKLPTQQSIQYYLAMIINK